MVLGPGKDARLGTMKALLGISCLALQLRLRTGRTGKYSGRRSNPSRSRYRRRPRLQILVGEPAAGLGAGRAAAHQVDGVGRLLHHPYLHPFEAAEPRSTAALGSSSSRRLKAPSL